MHMPEGGFLLPNRAAFSQRQTAAAASASEERELSLIHIFDNNMFPSVEVDCGSFVVACPCCGSQIPCLDIRFIDARDKLSDEVKKRTGVHMPVYPEKCPVCGLDIVYDAGDEG